VVDVWPQFRAPTDVLTRTMRVRDLSGMGSGIIEPAALSGLHEGDPTAPQLLQSIVNLPVAYPPVTTFSYNSRLRRWWLCRLVQAKMTVGSQIPTSRGGTQWEHDQPRRKSSGAENKRRGII
jgi:hypothetical protein